MESHFYHCRFRPARAVSHARTRLFFVFFLLVLYVFFSRVNHFFWVFRCRLQSVHDDLFIESLLRLRFTPCWLFFRSPACPSPCCVGVPNDRVDVTVQDLPGLSMSVCLAMLDTTGDVISAREAMASTLLRFPIMLEPLLEK